jgi:hypothetical protein
MKVCPECKGEKEFKLPSNHPLDVYNTDNPTVYKIYKCGTCEGSGTVSGLKLAIYKARGGPAPKIMRGYA